MAEAQAGGCQPLLAAGVWPEPGLHRPPAWPGEVAGRFCFCPSAWLPEDHQGLALLQSHHLLEVSPVPPAAESCLRTSDYLSCASSPGGSQAGLVLVCVLTEAGWVLLKPFP